MDVKDLGRDIEVAQTLLARIDDELRAVSVGQADAKAIETALRQTDEIIDQRLATFRRHPLLGPVIEDMRQQYRHIITDQAVPARSSGIRFRQSIVGLWRRTPR